MYKQIKVFRNITDQTECNQFLKEKGKYVITVRPVVRHETIGCVVEYYVPCKQSKEQIEAFTQ